MINNLHFILLFNLYSISDGSSYSLSQYPYMTIIDSYTCPDNYTSLLDCSFSTTNVGECVDFNSTTRISITCRRGNNKCN